MAFEKARSLTQTMLSADFFLSDFTTTILPLVSGDFSVYALLCTFGMIFFVGRRVVEWLDAYFTSTIYIHDDDPLYHIITFWIKCQPFGKSARFVHASIGQHGTNVPVNYEPHNGTLHCLYKYHLVTIIQTQIRGYHGQPMKQLSLSCISLEVLKKLIAESCCHYEETNQNKTQLFRHIGEMWIPEKSVPKRPRSTVILKKEVEEELDEDISRFTDDKPWYTRHAIPYKRGYLLHGPPGTGKSSLVLSIAGQYGLNLYNLNLSILDDKTATELFNKLPRSCVLLIEDIDAFSSKRLKHSDTDISAPQHNPPVSLSTLLNLIDGAGSMEGRILFITTNNINCLDNALIRPGRVDLRLELGFVDKTMVIQLFNFVYDESKITKLAKEFASKIPQNKFSSAEVLSYLINHKESSVNAIAQAEIWVQKVEKERENRAATNLSHSK